MRSKSRLYSWHADTAAWVAIDEGPVRAMHEGAARRYDTARKHGLTGAAFLPWLGGQPVGTPEKFGVEVVGAETPPAPPEDLQHELALAITQLRGLTTTAAHLRYDDALDRVVTELRRLALIESRVRADYEATRPIGDRPVGPVHRKTFYYLGGTP